MNRLLGSVAIVLCALGAWYAYSSFDLRETPAVNSTSTEVVPSAGFLAEGGPRERPALVSALATLEPVSGVIEISAAPGDRLEQLLVREGQSVLKGDVIAVLESTQLRTQELSAAETALKDALRREPLERAYAAALLTAADAGVAQAKLVELELGALQARLALTHKNVEVARSDLARLDGVSDRIVSAQDRDHQKLRVQQAEAEAQAQQAELQRLTASSKATLAQAEAKVNEARTTGDRLLAALQIDSLTQNVALAKKRLELSAVRSPLDGVVLQVLSREGETLAQKPIARVADVRRMVALCEVYETQVWCVRPQQRVTLASRALATPLMGVVERVGTLVARNQVLSLNPTEATDNRVVQVRVAIDESFSVAAAQLIHLQVDAAIDTSKPALSTP